MSRSGVEALPCAFERALLAGCAGCALAARRAVAEREALVCSSPVARTNCETLHALLRERSAFVVRVPPSSTAVTHAVAMRVACGGLRGVADAVDLATTDVHALVQAAQQRYGSLDALPWPSVVAAVAAWQGKRRRGGGAPR